MLIVLGTTRIFTTTKLVKLLEQINNVRDVWKWYETCREISITIFTNYKGISDQSILSNSAIVVASLARVTLKDTRRGATLDGRACAPSFLSACAVTTLFSSFCSALLIYVHNISFVIPTFYLPLVSSFKLHSFKLITTSLSTRRHLFCTSKSF